MRSLAAASAAALSLILVSAAPGIPPPVMDDPNGGTPWSCRWNPYAYWAGVWWVGQFQWYDPIGNATGIPCV